jgi:hypothetical protein
MVQTIARTEPTEFPMKLLMISGCAAVALLAAATTTMLRSHSPSTNHPVATADTTSPPAAAGANKLPIEEFEDMSLVHSTVPKR